MAEQGGRPPWGLYDVHLRTVMARQIGQAKQPERWRERCRGRIVVVMNRVVIVRRRGQRNELVASDDRWRSCDMLGSDLIPGTLASSLLRLTCDEPRRKR